jgi:hypothetical protein
VPAQSSRGREAGEALEDAPPVEERIAPDRRRTERGKTEEREK